MLIKIKYFTLFISIILLISCTEDKFSNSNTKDSTVFKYQPQYPEQNVTKLKKFKNLNELIQDSIKNGRKVNDIFLDFKLGELKSTVLSKIKKHRSTGKLKWGKLYDIQRNFLYYEFKIQGNHEGFYELHFEYFNNKLYHLTLRYVSQVMITNIYYLKDSYDEIVRLYKEKYVGKWFSNADSTKWENLTGTRLISLLLSGDGISIKYLDLKLENSKKEYENKMQKEDI